MAFEFLIVGAGRGGTSLLAGLLDSHPELEVGFEVDSIEYLMAPGRERPAPSTERATLFRKRCDELGAATASARWGNKITTEQLRGLENDGRARSDVLAQFFDVAFGDVHVVFVLRDGRSCVRSKMRRKGFGVEDAVDRWRYSVVVHDALIGRPKTDIVRFEDLLADPEGTLSPVCASLGVAWSPAMLEGTTSEKMRPEYRRAGLDGSASDVTDVPEGCLELIADDLRRLGYLAT